MFPLWLITQSECCEYSYPFVSSLKVLQLTRVRFFYWKENILFENASVVSLSDPRVLKRAIKISNFSNFVTFTGFLAILRKLYFSPSVIEHKLLLVCIASECYLASGYKGKLEKLQEIPQNLPLQ